MQKWEYLFIRSDFFREGWKITFISDPALEDWAEDISEHELSKRLGEQGWELISYAPLVGNPYGTTTMGLTEVRMVFKRPKI